MSVLIKGMELPKNCDVCQFSDWSNLKQTASCKILGYAPCFKYRSREYEVKRSDKCPLVEVPTPHGRLVEFIDVVVIDDDDTGTESINLGDALSAYLRMRSAPTVIEAEGERT